MPLVALTALGTMTEADRPWIWRPPPRIREPSRCHCVASSLHRWSPPTRMRSVSARRLERMGARLHHLPDSTPRGHHLSHRVQLTGDKVLQLTLWRSPRPNPLRPVTLLLRHLHHYSSHLGLLHVFNMGFANQGNTPMVQCSMDILLLNLNLQIYLMLSTIRNGEL
jgi:hypothetical protein